MSDSLDTDGNQASAQASDDCVADCDVPVDELRRLTMVVASEFIASARGRSVAPTPQLSAVLTEWARTDVYGRPPIRPIPGAHPNGATALRSLGMSRDHLRQLVETTRRDHGGVALLPPRVVLAFFTPAHLLVLTRLITDGPSVFHERLRLVLNVLGAKGLPGNRNRPAGSMPSKATLKVYQSAARRAAQILCNLRSHYPSRVLDQWVQVPPAVEINAPDAVTDRSAPPLRRMRLAYQQLEREVAEALHCDRTTGLQHAVEGLSSSALAHSTGFVRFKTFGIYVTLCVLGARISAVMELRRCDFLKDHRDPEGNPEYAIRLRPGKREAAAQVSVKPLPREMGEILHAFARYTELCALKRYGIELEATWPLWPADLRDPSRPPSVQAIQHRFGGKQGVRTVIPRDIDGDPHIGYSAHTLRSGCMQMTLAGAPAYCAENNISVDVRHIVECLVDHKHISDDKYGYYDVNRAVGRERYSRWGAQIAWQMLTGARGARTTIDVDACRDLHVRRRRLGDREAEVQRELTRLLSEPAPADVPMMMSRLTTSQRLQVEERRISAGLLTLREELHGLIHDPRRHIAVPDEIEDLPRVDLAALEGGQADDVYSETLPRVRDYLSVREVGEIHGVSDATARRWANGETLPHKDGDPRNPWDRASIPCDDSLGVKRRRLYVDQMKEGFFDTEAKRQFRDELLSRWPRGWSRKHAASPLPPLEPS